MDVHSEARFDMFRIDCSEMDKGVDWLREHTKLAGVDSVLSLFYYDECSVGSQTWVLPRSVLQMSYAVPEVGPRASIHAKHEFLPRLSNVQVEISNVGVNEKLYARESFEAGIDWKLRGFAMVQVSLVCACVV